MDYLGRNAWLQTYSFEPTSSPWQANIFDIFVNWNKAFRRFKIWNGIKIRLNVRCGRNLKAHSKFKFKSGSTTASFLLIFVLFKHEKTETSSGFKLGSLEEKASMLTTWPPPRPNNFVTLKIREIEIKFDRLENYQNVYQPFMKRDNIKEMDQFWC